MFPTELCVVSVAQAIDTLCALRPARLNNGLSPRGQSSTLSPSPPESLHTANLIAFPEGVLVAPEWEVVTPHQSLAAVVRGENYTQKNHTKSGVFRHMPLLYIMQFNNVYCNTF